MTFYDMDLNKIAQKINFPIKILENAEASINNYVNECFNILSDYYDSLLVALLLNEIERDLFNTDFGDNESINLKVNQTFIYFAYLKLFIEKYADGRFETLEEFNKIALSQQSMTAKYHLTKDNELCLTFVIDNISTLIALELINLKNSNIPIKKCENYKKVFIPISRSDEIYCDRIFKNNKTCKQLGYTEKAKKNPFMQMFTKARKTQHARIRYNSHISDYKEKHYEPWRIAAEKARDEYQKANDINGFQKWLDEHKNSF